MTYGPMNQGQMTYEANRGRMTWEQTTWEQTTWEQTIQERTIREPATSDDATVRVEPDALLRAAAALADLSAVVGREEGSDTLMYSPVGWTVRSAAARLHHAVLQHLRSVSEQLSACGDGLQAAATAYRESQQAAADQLRRAGQVL